MTMKALSVSIGGGVFTVKSPTELQQAADSTQAPVPAAVTGGKSIVEDEEFSLAKVSFGVIGLGLGLSLLSYGFGAYFNILPGSEWSAIMLTYGFPLTIIGMALKYAELKPVPCLTYSDAQILREKCATPILKQVRDDVIRYRYGDEQHLEEALKRIFQYGLGGGVARRNAPILTKIREEVTEDGKYCLVLVFEAKALELADFEKRQEKFASFFGPGITAEVGKGEEEKTYDVATWRFTKLVKDKYNQPPPPFLLQERPITAIHHIHRRENQLQPPIKVRMAEALLS
ncbi:unnamed protein product [Lactuca saligna]|uniref:Thylakoid membrane protein slr0575 n=1 Tax=Lactuca saligna TaxID=75948 RepID=A0AA36E554_LACSI|nr:unnamed protein product [Lactuca saligna]